MSTFVIAEAGSCHDCSIDKAQHLIELAKEAGADAVKFQYWSSAERLARRRRAESYLPVYQKYRLPEHWLAALKAYADDVGIEFMCTSYLPEDVWRVAEYCQRLKIASFEANDPELLVAHVAPLNAGREVYVSCGMGARAAPIEDWLVRGYTGTAAPRVVLLHCVSAYPAPIDQLQLVKIRRSQSWARLGSCPPIGGLLAGFSDHSEADHTWTGALAVAAGACVLERHVRREDGDPSNPDYPHAMNPRAFREYVRHVRFAETVVGAADEHVSGAGPAEAAMMEFRAWRDQ